jgi:hypothetical protein
MDLYGLVVMNTFISNYRPRTIVRTLLVTSDVILLLCAISQAHLSMPDDDIEAEHSDSDHDIRPLEVSAIATDVYDLPGYKGMRVHVSRKRNGLRNHVS